LLRCFRCAGIVDLVTGASSELGVEYDGECGRRNRRVLRSGSIDERESGAPSSNTAQGQLEIALRQPSS